MGKWWTETNGVGDKGGTDADVDIVHASKMMQGDTHLAYHSHF